MGKTAYLLKSKPQRCQEGQALFLAGTPAGSVLVLHFPVEARVS